LGPLRQALFSIGGVVMIIAARPALE